MNAADLLIRCLEHEGVEFMFGVPGEETLDVMDSILGSRIRFVTTRHEQGAAFMADVYGRLSGKAGVCLSTLGPGATNLMTGVADANLDHAPLVAISGQVSTERKHAQSHQYIDLQALFKPITKWNGVIATPTMIQKRCERRSRPPKQKSLERFIWKCPKMWQPSDSGNRMPSLRSGSNHRVFPSPHPCK